ncbi:MAG: hypothetical protein AUI15_41085 [Actinobacteria bacterium 13_2_20CM_2_66_6]|jgi:hypothetical protein|nr:MAG: hypothetical protein AUI15_41085 [Actinobacteria bacterium 13_2_20CM_2_66_6]
MPPNVLLLVSVDTEDDNWHPRREGVTVENVRELPRLAALFRRLGVRATYFTTYQVAIRDWAAGLLRELRTGGAEIAAHLHPWNTPPLDEALVPRNSMLKNLPAALQLAKLERLTVALREAVGVQPRAFRAGRYALGPDTVAALLRCGYAIDSSVTPFVSWADTDDGPTFVGAPVDAYRVGQTGDARIPVPDGGLLEMPMSIGYNRTPFAVWDAVRRALASRPLRPLHLTGLAARLGIVKRIFLSPEIQSVPDMLALSRCLIDGGARQLHMFFHSPSLRPGLSPHSPTAAAVQRLYDGIASYVEALSRTTSLTFATVSEAAAALEHRPAGERTVVNARQASTT